MSVTFTGTSAVSASGGCTRLAVVVQDLLRLGAGAGLVDEHSGSSQELQHFKALHQLQEAQEAFTLSAFLPRAAVKGG